MPVPHPRWRVVLTATPYVVLGVLVIFSLAVQWGQWAHLGPSLVLCGAAALWVLALRDLPLPWRGNRVTVAVLVGGMIVLNLLLVLRDGWFGFLTVATFSFAYSMIAWPWELLPVAATAVVAGWAQSSDFGHDPVGVFATATVIALNIAVMCGLSWGLSLAQQQAQRAATEAERSRLAREIHDTLAQSFAGIVTQLQAAEQAADGAARARHADAALALARDGLAEARRSVQALRPAALDAVRLPEALGNVARGWSARTGIPVDVVAPGGGRELRTETEVALLRTAQEALANVEQHAAAHRVVLELRTTGTRARLEVRDDGCGFDQSAARGPTVGGYGLVAMRERIESVAGTLAVESHPGRGTAVRAEVPA
ncbi:sensor histidine kinase [Gryllotalpicola protaetiae]|uniref:Sensor histidine kinase n=1 Tax=Gryllotalpicola protaetiae TaxID=2419771 RepID=A0A387BKP9_9MICO|nr:sensor histidine kinase [Gryllotalpicola protaetiae]AYG02744.1 sensor histidine kinase [Gryllotalpicola protaetiae]